MTSKVITQDQPVPTASPGIADIVGFGTKGVVILRNAVNIQTFEVVKNFGYDAGGWRTDKHVRLLADTTGNRAADIVGFGETGVWISVNNGNNSFTDPPKLVLSDFAIGNGWSIEKHIRYVADIRKVGRADIIGFGDTGVVVSSNIGGGNFSPSYVALADFGYNQTWRIDKHLRFLADVTGNGLLDIVGFGENHIYTSLNNGNGTFAAPKVANNLFCYGDTWRIDKHPRFVADLTGNKKVDVVGFGTDYVYTALNNGDGTFGAAKHVLNYFSLNQGWLVNRHPRFVADLTGNGKGDLIGFADEGVWVALGNGDGTFQQQKRVVDNFGYNQGWRVDKHPRFVVDLTGDGRADIIGFGDKFVWVSYNQGNGDFGPVTKLTDKFAFNGGEWSLDQTVRYVTNLYN